MTLQLEAIPLTAPGEVEDRVERWRDLDLAPADPIPAPVSDGRVDEPEAAGFTLTRLAVATVAAILAARIIGLPLPAGWALLTVAAAVALRPVATVRTALAGAVTAWLLGTGFLADRLGVLAFGAADQGRLAVLVLVAVVVALARRWAFGARRTS